MMTSLTIWQFIIVSAVGLIIYNHINYFGTRKLIGALYNKYKNEAGTLLSGKILHDKTVSLSGLDREKAVLEASAVRRLGGGDILTIAVSNIEFILIATLSILAMQDGQDKSIYEVSYKIGVIAVALVGIKVIGNYGQWNLPIFGRSIFSVFLLGTIINISLAIAAAIVFVNIT